jgi:protein-L-isoaspartate O-methyltransferase
MMKALYSALNTLNDFMRRDYIILKKASELLKSDKIIFKLCDGRNGCPDYASYNCIHVCAGK